MDGLLSLFVTWAAIVMSVLYLAYRRGTSTFSYFSDQGIPGPTPRPFVGNLWGAWKKNLPKNDVAIVKKYGKIVGIFDGQQPDLWVTDADFIKAVFVKDFDHFINRRDIRFHSKFLRKMVTIMRDQEWKDVRSALTPAFTTGKIKRMSTMISECAQRLTGKFEAIAADNGKFDAKNEFSAFTMDVIARCVFCMTFDDIENKDNPFMEKAKKASTIPLSKSPIMLLPVIFPKAMGSFAEKFVVAKEFSFFFSILEKLIKEREHSQDKYNDFIEMATEAIAGYSRSVGGETVSMWTKEEVEEIVVSQATVFLLAGFDTTSTTLANTCFLLARNPDVQQKLYEEIMSRIEEFGEINHDMILDFPYIDQIIHEALRIYPPIPRIERECSKDFTYKGINLKKGTVVTVPVFALHNDTDYYPEPEKFNPDRWSKENLTNVHQYVWMPFGMGPRNCVGMRFAMEEIKIALCTLVKQFRFFPVEETPEKLEFEDGFIAIAQPINSVVGIEKRV